VSTSSKILQQQSERGWTDSTLVKLLLDAIEELSYAHQDTILCHIQYVIDCENKAAEDEIS
jgi:hypothetical protein